jgi:hypothetical protein
MAASAGVTAAGAGLASAEGASFAAGADLAAAAGAGLEIVACAGSEVVAGAVLEVVAGAGFALKLDHVALETPVDASAASTFWHARMQTVCMKAGLATHSPAAAHVAQAWAGRGPLGAEAAAALAAAFAAASAAAYATEPGAAAAAATTALLLEMELEAAREYAERSMAT